MDELIKIISARLGSPILTCGDEIRFNCFRLDCGKRGVTDSSHHLYINPIKEKFFCQRCQKGSTLE